MRPRYHKLIPQLPPTWTLWLTAMKVLTEYGASIHERAQGNPPGSLHINRHDREPKTLEFFRHLVSEKYTDFDAIDGPRSATLTAIRTKEGAVAALGLLKSQQVDICSISHDGRSSVHLAAEMAYTAGVLNYLCTNGALEDLNRQGELRWTPLHYSVVSAFLRSESVPFEKTRFLLSRGANPHIKAESLPTFVRVDVPSRGLDVKMLCALLGENTLVNTSMFWKKSLRKVTATMMIFNYDTNEMLNQTWQFVH